jgi:hypothetical protein
MVFLACVLAGIIVFVVDYQLSGWLPGSPCSAGRLSDPLPLPSRAYAGAGVVRQGGKRGKLGSDTHRGSRTVAALLPLLRRVAAVTLEPPSSPYRPPPRRP